MSRICRKVEDDCPRCNGTGRRGRGYCHRCGGHGTVLTKTCSCGCSQYDGSQYKCKEVRKWITIAAERSTTMRRHRVCLRKLHKDPDGEVV